MRPPRSWEPWAAAFLALVWLVNSSRESADPVVTDLFLWGSISWIVAIAIRLKKYRTGQPRSMKPPDKVTQQGVVTEVVVDPPAEPGRSDHGFAEVGQSRLIKQQKDVLMTSPGSNNLNSRQMIRRLIGALGALLFVFSLAGLVVPMETDVPLWSVDFGINNCSGSVLDNWNNPDSVKRRTDPGSGTQYGPWVRDYRPRECREAANSQAARLGLVATLSVVVPLLVWWVSRQTPQRAASPEHSKTSGND